MKRLIVTLATCGIAGALAGEAGAQVNPGPLNPGEVTRPATEPARDRATTTDMPAEQPAPGAPGQPAAAGGAAAPSEPGRPGPVRAFSATVAEATDQDRALVDQAARYLKLKRYAEAAPLFEKLRMKYDTIEYQVKYALCLYELNKLDDAKAIYEKVLQEDPQNVLGLLSIARINTKFASQEREPAKVNELLERAREALRAAARNGANCLRAIKTYPEFERFRNDVQLQISLIKEPQQIIQPPARDPFRNPLPRVADPTKGPAVDDPREVATRLSPEEQKKLVERAEALLEQVEKMITEENFDGLARVWLEIEDIIRQEQKIKSLDILARLGELKRKFKDKQALAKSLLLKGYYAQGERMIGDMQVKFDQQAYGQVFEMWATLQGHTKRMRETDEQFGKAAEDLEKRGQEWYAKAKILEEIDKIKFDITGIVAGASVAKAIINNRILSENDIVYDQRGNPITELRVQTIKKRRVRFHYKGLEFERPLLSPK